jgi:2-polyprenyl-6-methoxyphenol hydroxylase-like FAD-dependent oxidoreductase
MGDETGTRAVVLGGSIAGLFAARVLADVYDEVRIVDRDVLVGADGPRRHAPQGRHINGLLARGHQVMEELFPGITAQLVDYGVPLGDLSGSCRWYFAGRRLKQQHGNLVTLAATRPVLERHIRQRVQAIPHVVFDERHDILGLETTPDRGRVTGVQVQRHGRDTAEVIRADLVVDATGRGSRVPVWLEQLGYPRVREDRQKVDLVYVTQHYRLRDGADPFQGDVAINPVAYPGLPRGAVFVLTDGGRLELTTYGLHGNHPPTEQAAFYQWVKTLPAPDVYEAIQHADPLDEPVAFRFPTTIRRRYENLERFPDGLLLTGDAVTCFNPVYAQGMSVAALGALTMRQHLHSGADPVPLDYFRDLARDVIDQPWQMTITVDLNFPQVEGDRPLQLRLAQTYLRLVQRAATRDGSVTAAYMRAAGLVDRPDALMRPSMLLRVLWNSILGPPKESTEPARWPLPRAGAATP